MSGTAGAGRGMPLLSGPPPEIADRADVSCRRCDREFNVIFNRRTVCNHCGFVYCHSCASFHALMPRQGMQSGYDPAPVCSFCMPLLQITAGGKAFLRSLPVKKLNNYLQAYRISVGHDVLEKDDIIEAIIAARGPNGCLPPAHENFYRKNSVPNAQTSNPRTFFSRGHSSRVTTETNRPSPWSQTQEFARPDLEQDHAPSSSTRSEASNTRHFHRERHSTTFQGGDPESNNSQSSDPSSARFQRESRPYQGPSYDSTYDARNRGGRPTSARQNPSSGSQRGTPVQSNDHSSSRFSGNPSSMDSDWFYMGSAAPNFNRQRSSSSYSSFYGESEGRLARGNNVAHSSDRTSTRGTREHLSPEQNLNSPQTSTNADSHQRTSNSPVNLQAPSLDELLTMQEDAISHLAVSTLKAILFSNHVNARNILEKSELVSRVRQLIATERQERARMAHIHEMEELEGRLREEERQRDEQERLSRRERFRTTVEEIDDVDGLLPSSSTASLTPSEPLESSQPLDDRAKLDKPMYSSPVAERSGLCIICQDEDANIVIIDCGHLALCRACSDLVMSTTRECPLCRTRIVTEARLLRVFKT